MSFDKIFDLKAGVYLNFDNIDIYSYSVRDYLLNIKCEMFLLDFCTKPINTWNLFEYGHH